MCGEWHWRDLVLLFEGWAVQLLVSDLVDGQGACRLELLPHGGGEAAVVCGEVGLNRWHGGHAAEAFGRLDGGLGAAPASACAAVVGPRCCCYCPHRDWPRGVQYGHSLPVWWRPARAPSGRFEDVALPAQGRAIAAALQAHPNPEHDADLVAQVLVQHAEVADERARPPPPPPPPGLLSSRTHAQEVRSVGRRTSSLQCMR